VFILRWIKKIEKVVALHKTENKYDLNKKIELNNRTFLNTPILINQQSIQYSKISGMLIF
jgi:hypothetical protein